MYSDLIHKTALISCGATVDKSVKIGEYTIIGNDNNDDNILIGEETVIRRFCFIDKDVIIGQKCVIGDGVYVYKHSKIGNNVRLETKSMICARCSIGDGCIIDGIVMNKVIMEENVRFFGQLAHSHRNHTLDWKTTSEPSPVFRKNSMVGVGALIIGPVEVGENSYVASGEILRFDLPANTILYKGQIYPKEKFRGLII